MDTAGRRHRYPDDFGNRHQQRLACHRGEAIERVQDAIPERGQIAYGPQRLCMVPCPFPRGGHAEGGQRVFKA